MRVQTRLEMKKSITLIHNESGKYCREKSRIVTSGLRKEETLLQMFYDKTHQNAERQYMSVRINAIIYEYGGVINM